MARTIQVTPEQLESAAGKIDSLAAEYKEQYNALYKETDSMALWEGKDSKAFVAQIAGFKDDLEKMYNLMLKYADFLKKSAKAYRQTQDTAVMEARKLAN